MKSALVSVALAILAFPISILAHEGHGHTEGSSPLHYVIEPMHALVFLVVVASVAGIIYRYRKQSRKQ